MAASKSTTLTLRTAAEQEHRSITNMVEVLIRDYCAKHSITVVNSATNGPLEGKNKCPHWNSRESSLFIRTTSVCRFVS
ncbi:hypothetical protein [Acidithiobacillus acidisediminis]|uniref:hypothetical protein n=1 Tax=Acidithiobacillus acidisediminis TaxID=2937799 RepID=UPI00200EE25D|nr:hypothetical protein [Acidithiobacillus sp. S30A2]